ncbi:MAG: hypothetical protein LBB84_09360 [Tannerellaceae bacterium]|jgi:hypothetical protein|nr:hypothetical protein [Tannerellaceae bacterium]
MRTKKFLLIALFCVTVTGCEYWEIPVWSHVIKFRSQLNQLKCEDAIASMKEEEWDLAKESEASIVGTWKLLLDFSAGDTVDRSCTSAYYTFHADGTVEIESEIEEIASGTFAYEYYTDPYCPWCDPVLYPRPNLYFTRHGFVHWHHQKIENLALTHIAAFPPRVVKFQLKTDGFCLEFFT